MKYTNILQKNPKTNKRKKHPNQKTNKQKTLVSLYFQGGSYTVSETSVKLKIPAPLLLRYKLKALLISNIK